MNRALAILGGTIVAAGLTLGAFGHEGQHEEGDSGKPVTIQGELVDTACFVSSDGKSKGSDHAGCAKDCMASGIPAAILPDGAKDSDEMLYLLVNPIPLAPYAAREVKVEGKQYDDKHAIEVTKISVKDGDNWKEIQLKDEHHKEKAEQGK